MERRRCYQHGGWRGKGGIDMCTLRADLSEREVLSRQVGSHWGDKW